MIWDSKYLFLTFPVAGLCLVAGGLRYRWHLKAKVTGFERVNGTVIDNAVEREGGSDSLYRPTVQYSAGNRCYKIGSGAGCNPRKEAGTILVISFDPANTATAHIAEDYYGVANFILGIGVGFIAFSIIFDCVMIF